MLQDFTAYSFPSSQERIMQMRALYDKYSLRGFDIYQVSVDSDEHYWKTACEGLASMRDKGSLRLPEFLPCTPLPTYSLINRHGVLVARDEQVEDLEKTVGRSCE